jgi:hypothetical protein
VTTWRTFATRRNAEIYALAVWLRILRRRAAEGDGTLLNIVTRLRERVVDEWPDDHETLRTTLTSLTNAQLAALVERSERLPLLGRRLGQLVIDDGHTLRWDIPRQTADGRWAVQCPDFDPAGGPEPAWPTSPALP